jgi:hypothetical protein
MRVSAAQAATRAPIPVKTFSDTVCRRDAPPGQLQTSSSRVPRAQRNCRARTRVGYRRSCSRRTSGPQLSVGTPWERRGHAWSQLESKPDELVMAGYAWRGSCRPDASISSSVAHRLSRRHLDVVSSRRRDSGPIQRLDAADRLWWVPLRSGSGAAAVRTCRYRPISVLVVAVTPATRAAKSGGSAICSSLTPSTRAPAISFCVGTNL